MQIQDDHSKQRKGEPYAEDQKKEVDLEEPGNMGQKHIGIQEVEDGRRSTIGCCWRGYVRDSGER